MLFRNSRRAVRFSLLIILFMSACSPAGTVEEIPERELTINFFALIKMSTENQVRMDIGVSSVSGPYEDPAFSGLWELRDEGGDLRASGLIESLPLVSGEEILISWEGVLEPGEYELTWGAPAYGGLVNQFEVVEENGVIKLGSHQNIHKTTAYPPVMP